MVSLAQSPERLPCGFPPPHPEQTRQGRFTMSKQQHHRIFSSTIIGKRLSNQQICTKQTFSSLHLAPSSSSLGGPAKHSTLLKTPKRAKWSRKISLHLSIKSWMICRQVWCPSSSSCKRERKEFRFRCQGPNHVFFFDNIHEREYNLTSLSRTMAITSTSCEAKLMESKSVLPSSTRSPGSA